MISWKNEWSEQVRSRITKTEINGKKICVYKDMEKSPYYGFCVAAEKFPDKTAIVDDEENTLSYQELLVKIDRTAGFLRKKWNIKKGDHIGLLLYNGIPFCVYYLALNKLGAVTVPIPGKFKKDEILSLAEKAEIKAVVCEKKFQAWMDEAEIDTWLPEMEVPDCIDSQEEAEEAELEDGAILMFTSGTTSHSKGVLMKNYHVMNSVEAYIETLKLNETDRSLIATPMYHVTGMICILTVFLTAGGTVYLMKKVDGKKMVACFVEHEITFYHASPTVFSILLDEMKTSPEIPSMKGFACGSGNMPPENICRLKEWMPQAKFHTVYGMTETSGAGTIFPEGAADSPWIGSSGVPMPDLEVRIIGETGEELEVGQIGEICLKGSFVLEEYYQQETDLFTPDGWLKTGDLGYTNEAGYLYVVDRKKDMINRGGEKICSFDIENVLHEIQGIAEAAVVGVPDKKYMEVPAALVRLENGAELSADEIKEILKEKIAKFKIPVYIEFTNEIPKTHNGKIDKRMIRTTFFGSYL